MLNHAWPIIGFNLFVLAMLALDLYLHRDNKEVSLRHALGWSAVWVAMAIAFNLIIFFFWGTLSPESTLSSHEAALAFATGYLIEKSLSVDNLFVFAMIFSAFAVPRAYQHKVLFYGVVGALVMRGSDDSGGQCVDRPLSLVALCLWRAADLYRYQDGDAQK